MRPAYVAIGAVLLVAAIFAMIVPMWISTAGMGLPAAGWGAVILMVFFCFAVGGGLMFLLFFSARRGFDDDAHGSARGASHRDEYSPPPDAER